MNNYLRSLQINRYIAVITLTPMLLGGCASTSTQYKRQNAAKGEIVWYYDRELKASKEGKLICGDNWDGLSQSVDSLPEAKGLAESARNNHTTGVVLQWSGASVMIGGFILGVATMASELDERHGESYSNSSSLDPFSYDGFWIIMGGWTLGATMLLGGNHSIQQGTADAIDAVNIYNCKIEKDPKGKE
jgi:hypothetical protein